MCHECQIKHNPAEETGTHLHEDFDVDGAEDGNSDTWVEFPTYEPVVQHVAGVTTGCEFALLRVAWDDREGADVDESREDVRNNQVGGENLKVVPPDENPWCPCRTIVDRACGEDAESDAGGAEGVELVGQFSSCRELSALDVCAWKDGLQGERQEVPAENSQCSFP